MRIVKDYPPIFDEIDRAFNLNGRRVIFAWGDTIFNPYDIDVPPCLLAHEAVHGARQGADILGWWRRYMDEPAFRFAEEVPAHIAEYQSLVSGAGGNRDARRRYLTHVAQRLASPLYGSLISVDKAKQQLKLAERSLREAA